MPPPTTTVDSPATSDTPPHKTSPSPHTAVNGHHTSDVAMESNNTSQQGESEQDQPDDDGGNGDGSQATIAARAAADNADPSFPPVKTLGKIKLVLNARKRKADDSWSAAAPSEVATPEPSSTPTPDATANNGSAAPEEDTEGPASAVTAAGPDETRAETAAAEEEAQQPSFDQTLIPPPQASAPDESSSSPNNTDPTEAVATTNNFGDQAQPPPSTTPDASVDTTRVDTETANATAAGTAAGTPSRATSTPVPDDKPKRQPRKRRKWLRKGEVDPDDPQAVAQQKARHALIDSAIEALDEQEQLILDDKHPKLLELWEELERRYTRKIAYCEAMRDAQQAELKHQRDVEVDHHKFQFRVSPSTNEHERSECEACGSCTSRAYAGVHASRACGDASTAVLTPHLLVPSTHTHTRPTARTSQPR